MDSELGKLVSQFNLSTAVIRETGQRLMTATGQLALTLHEELRKRVGAPQLAMHSARELMGARDVSAYSAALAAFLTPAEVTAR